LKKNGSSKFIVITGPTASGKTQLSVALAEILNSEIISADSRQIYKYLDIGTAKPDPEEMKKVKHHLISILEPDQYFSAGEYQKMARKCLKEIFLKGKIPIVAGGSGLYISALVEGVFEGDYKDDAVRAEFKKIERERGSAHLFRILEKMDPETAMKIHSNDSKRIIRALEVCTISGRKMSDLKREKTKKCNYSPVYFGLLWERRELYNRINIRVEKMVEKGLFQEVRRILKMGFSPDLNSLDSVGYKEVLRYFNGELSEREAVELIKQNTRRYAKKQMIWFRKNPEIKWLPADSSVSFTKIAEKIAEEFIQK